MLFEKGILVSAILNCIYLLSWLTASSKVNYFYQRVAVHPKRKCVKVGRVDRGRFVTFAAEREELEEIS